MKSDRQWFVRVERQPHRDAVRRLRKAYGKLWQLSEVTPSSTKSSRQAPDFAQEVRK
jgi:hypothetical protein